MSECESVSVTASVTHRTGTNNTVDALTLGQLQLCSGRIVLYDSYVIARSVINTTFKA